MQMEEEPPTTIAEDYKKQARFQERKPQELRTPREDAIYKLQTALNLFPWLESQDKSIMIQQAKDLERLGAMNMKALAASLILRRSGSDLDKITNPTDRDVIDILSILAGDGSEDESKKTSLKRAYQAEIYRYLKFLQSREEDLE